MTSLRDTQGSSELTYDQFKHEWLTDILAGEPTSVEKGHRFATKLITQWLDVTEADEDLYECDGPGDGGIDIAYLRRSDSTEPAPDESQDEGDVWYVIQSKFGEAFRGKQTVIEEGRKVISTLAGENNSRLADSTHDLIARIGEFRKRSSERDKLTLVFATDTALNSQEREALQDIRILGNDRFPNLFDVQDISIRTIWDQSPDSTASDVIVPLKATLGQPDEDLSVGTVRLRSLYEFLKAYDKETGNLDLIYDRNVRQYLSGKNRINRGIKETLENTPEHFGLFNNGITIVVDSIERGKKRRFALKNPYIVNGCQTTKTIWEVLRLKLDSGGTGTALVDDWSHRLDRSFVVVKVVTSASQGTTDDITKYTNSQTAVRQQDFVSLDDDYRIWKPPFEEDHGVYLEIQRGGWDAQKARQKERRSPKNYSEAANAFELIKIIGAGWYDMPGAAFRSNTQFLSNGPAFARVTEKGNPSKEFDHHNLHAAYLLKKQADRLGFGRGAQLLSRRLTRFLFYMITVSMLRAVSRQNGLDTDEQSLAQAVNRLGKASDGGSLDLLADEAARAVDEYLNPDSELSAHKEDVYRNEFGQNLNQFLKSDALGTEDRTPNLRALLRDYQRTANRPTQGGKSLAETILATLADE